MSTEQQRRWHTALSVVLVMCQFFALTACGSYTQDPTVTLPNETTIATVPETTISTESTTVSTESTNVPSESTAVDTELQTEPTESTMVSTESTNVPTEPPTAPTELTTAPTESTTEPTEPDQKPTEETIPALTVPPDVYRPLIPEATQPPETTPPPTSPPAPTQPPETTPPEPFVQPDMPGAVPEGPRVDSSYFDDVVFIGDSISLKLTWYEAAMNVLGNAQFLTEGSLGSGNALWNVSAASRHPKYNGEKMLLRESVPLTGAKKMYIMLGMNDIGVYGISGAVANLTTLINAIKQNAPDIQVFIQSMTPTTSTSYLCRQKHTIENIVTYNRALLQACLDNGWYFVNVASAMYDEYGYLRMEYCSDPGNMGIHFSNAGCAAWVDYLYTHAVP